MIESLLAYAKSLNSSQDVIWWIENPGKKNITLGKVTVSQLEHVIDFMVSSAAPKRLRKMSLKDALSSTDKWTESNKKKGARLEDGEDDLETFMEFDDESRIVKLVSKKAFQREGNLMSHCLGGYDVRSGFDIYSLRDKANEPHATFEVSKNQEEILQIKGKGNGPIHPKYIHRVLAFLKKLGMEMRPSEMTNLGYYYVDPKLLAFVKSKIGKNERLVKLNEENYVV